MSGYKDAKDSYVDGRNHQGGPPLQSANRVLRLGDDGYSIDDNLHKELDLEDPEEQDEEQRGHAREREGGCQISIVLNAKCNMIV